MFHKSKTLNSTDLWMLRLVMLVKVKLVWCAKSLTVRRGHPKYSPTHCLHPLTPSSRLKPVVGRHFTMPGLPMDQSDVVFKTQSSIELDSSAFLPSHWTGRLSSLRRRSRSPPREREGADALASGGGALDGVDRRDYRVDRRERWRIRDYICLDQKLSSDILFFAKWSGRSTRTLIFCQLRNFRMLALNESYCMVIKRSGKQSHRMEFN